MKKTIICGIPMREYVAANVFESNDQSLPVSTEAYRYPVNSFLEKTLKGDDELKVILVVKRDGKDYYINNVAHFKDEINHANAEHNAKIEIVTIESDFEQDKEIHQQLMCDLVEQIDEGSNIIVDTTFGAKDLPVIIFAALEFAEKFLECEVENIVYGKAEFEDNKVVKSTICEMTSLYYLSSVTNTVKCDDPSRAKQMLKSLLSL